MQPLNLDPKKTALVVIDIQKGIVGLKGEPNDGDAMLNNVIKLADTFRAKGALVTLVHVDFLDGKDALKPMTDQPAASSYERPADWADIVPELGPKQGDIVITKRQWGAFFDTGIDLQLRRRGIDTIVLCGISTNIGVETTAREAYQRNYQQIFAIDAMNALSKEEHDNTNTYIFPRMGRVRTTEEIVNAF